MMRRYHPQTLLMLTLAGVLTFSRAAAAIPGLAQAAPSQDDFTSLANRAAAARDSANTNEAIRLYANAVKLHPDWDEGLWYLGVLNYDQDRYSDAMPPLRSLLQLNPQIGAAWAFLGLCEFETQDYEHSLAHLEKAEGLGYAEGPEVARVAKYHLALLLNLNGAFEKATALLTAEFTQAQFPDQVKNALGMALLRVPLLPAQVDPSKDALLRAAGEAAASAARSDFGRAAVLLQQMFKLFPDTPYLHYACGNALLSASKYEDAVVQFREETRLRPADALPHVALASIALLQHRPADAVRSAQHAADLAPDLSSAHEVLAQALKLAGKPEPSARQLDIAKRLADHPPLVDASIARAYSPSRAGGLSLSPVPEETEAHLSTSEGPENIERLEEQARAAMKAGQADLAIGYYQRAVKIQPDWDEGWRSLGTLCYVSARYAEAAAALKNAVSLNARRSEAWALLGLAEFELKDYQNALIHLERGRDLGFSSNPAAVQMALYHTALLLNMNGEFDKAMDLLLPEAGRGAIADQISFALGIGLLRIPALPDQIEPAKEPLVRGAGEAAAFLAQSKYAEALPIFQRLLKNYPDTPYLHYAYGSALASLSQYDEAAAQLREEIRVTPASALPYLRLASMFLRMHRLEDALPNARRATQLAPQSAEGHYMLGRTFLELGKVPEAAVELETAARLAPDSPEVHFSLARAYTKAGRLPDAEQERAVFERLNSLVQQQKDTHGSQSLGASSNQSGLSTAPGEKQSTASPP
jgi:tetratricopeptide (TPR) repeat protein